MRKSVKTAITAICFSVIAFAFSACTVSTPTKKTKMEVPVISSVEYNGELQKAVVPENDGYSVTKNDGGISAGEYDVVLTLTDGKKYEWKTHDEGSESTVTLKFAITQADNEIISLVMEDRNVGEEGKAPVARAKFGVPAFTYSDKANGNFKAEIPTAQGKYFVKATVAETADYKGAEKVVSFRILNPNVATFTKVPAKIDGIVYDSFAHELITAGTTNDGTVQYKLGANGEWSENVPTATEAGEYEVFYRIKGDAEHGDYEVEDPIVVTIAKNTVTEPTANEELVYNGTAQELVTAGTTKGGTIKYKLGANGEWSENVPTATDAGEYTVFFKFVSGANETEEKSLSVSIAKATNVIDWQKDGDTYVSMDVAFGTAPAKLGVALGTITYKYTKAKLVNNQLTKDGDPADWSLTNGVGTYCCIATVEGTDNYEKAYAERFFTVYKAKTAIDWQKDGEGNYLSMDVAFGTAPAKLGIATFGTITYKYTKAKLEDGQFKKEGTPADWSLTNGVGTYCCIATVEGTDNYEGATNERFFTVFKAKNVIDWQKDGDNYVSMDVDFGSEPAKLGIATFGTITYKYTKAKLEDGQFKKEGTPADWSLTNGVGTYCCIATVEGTDNYEGATNERFFTVFKAKNVIDWQKDGDNYVSMDVDFGSEPAKLGIATFGTITYKYTKAKLEDGQFKKEGTPADWSLTNNAGVYCCIATVEGTDNYEGTTNERYFTVRKVTTKNGVIYEFDSDSDCYFVSGCEQGLEVVNVVDTFNNGENGEKTVKYVKASAFESNKDIKRVILPASVTELKGLAFFNCGKLEYLDMRGVATFGENNVTFCYNLTTVIVKEGITINGQQFQSSDESKNGVTTVYVDGTAGITIENKGFNKLIGKIIYKGTADECNVWYVENDVIKTSGDHTFGEDGKCSKCGCYGDTLTQGVVYAYDSATDSYYVSDNRSLAVSEVKILGTYNDGKHGEKNVTFVKYRAFDGNTNIIKVILHENVTSFDGSAFANCSNLEYVDMRGVKNLNVTTLQNLSHKAIYISSTGVTNDFTNNNFLNCGKLTTLVVGKEFTVGDGMFKIHNAPTLTACVNIYTMATSESDGTIDLNKDNNALLTGNIYYYDANGATGCWNFVDEVATLH